VGFKEKKLSFIDFCIFFGMPIIYSLVGRGSIVLCEYSTNKGNFTQVARTIMQKVPQTNSKMSYIYEKLILLN
jgi:vesicle-associated membrane protein 7